MDEIANAYEIIGMKYAYEDMEDLTDGEFKEYQHYEFICPEWCRCDEDDDYCENCFDTKEEHVKWFVDDYGGNEDEDLVQQSSSARVVVHTNAIPIIKNNINKYMNELGVTADNLEEWEKVFEDDDFQDEYTPCGSPCGYSKGKRVLVGFALLKILDHDGYMEYDYEW